jgi:hypothetical protein
MHSKTASRRRSSRIGRTVGWRKSALAATLSALAVGAVAGPAAATAAAVATPPDASANFAFQRIDNSADPTFNQLLGINNSDAIAGYFGSGMAGHPNKGYTLHVTYRNENFPGSAQTQVIGLNNENTTVGFWVNSAGANFGFYSIGGKRFDTADYPTDNAAKPAVDQLLGVNDSNVAVGFYTDGKGVNHGYSYNIATHQYKQIKVSGDTNVTAAAINNLGDVAGFASNGAGTTEGFLKLPNGKVVHLDAPGATTTQALGVNDGDEVVGDYTVGSGSSATTTGFVWSPGFGFESVNDPNGTGSTTINGVNDRGTLVGFYTDSAGNTDGLVARPKES